MLENLIGLIDLIDRLGSAMVLSPRIGLGPDLRPGSFEILGAEALSGRATPDKVSNLIDPATIQKGTGLLDNITDFRFNCFSFPFLEGARQ